MTIESTAVVDFIGVDAETDRVVLTIVDHLEWSHEVEESHLKILQDKINTYLRFIESGELIGAYADAEGRNVEILLLSKHESSESGRSFLRRASEILAGAGIVFRQEMLDGQEN